MRQKSKILSPTENYERNEARCKSLIDKPVSLQQVVASNLSMEDSRHEFEECSPIGTSEVIHFIEDLNYKQNKCIKPINSKLKLDNVQKKLASIPITYINTPVNINQNIKPPPLSTKNLISRNISNTNSRKNSETKKSLEKSPKESPGVTDKKHQRKLSNQPQSDLIKNELTKDISRSNLCLRNQRQRYSNRFGMNLQSYKVNVYNIGINANIGNIINKERNIANIKQRQGDVSHIKDHNKSGKKKRLPYPKNYFEVISRSMLQDRIINDQNSQNNYE